MSGAEAKSAAALLSFLIPSAVSLWRGRQEEPSLVPPHMGSAFSPSWEVVGTVMWCQTHMSQSRLALSHP